MDRRRNFGPDVMMFFLSNSRLLFWKLQTTPGKRVFLNSGAFKSSRLLLWFSSLISVFHVSLGSTVSMLCFCSAWLRRLFILWCRHWLLRLYLGLNRVIDDEIYLFSKFYASHSLESFKRKPLTTRWNKVNLVRVSSMSMVHNWTLSHLKNKFGSYNYKKTSTMSGECFYEDKRPIYKCTRWAVWNFQY